MDTPPNLSIANGEPKPLLPLGGNLADLTSLLASSAVSSRGTIIPWAGVVMGFSGQATAQDSHEPPESKAPTYDQRQVIGRCSNMRTLHHPAFIGGNPDNGTDSTRSNGGNSFVHCTVCSSC